MYCRRCCCNLSILKFANAFDFYMDIVSSDREIQTRVLKMQLDIVEFAENNISYLYQMIIVLITFHLHSIDLRSKVSIVEIQVTRPSWHTWSSRHLAPSIPDSHTVIIRQQEKKTINLKGSQLLDRIFLIVTEKTPLQEILKVFNIHQLLVQFGEICRKHFNACDIFLPKKFNLRN
jgi:hypothetical protein